MNSFTCCECERDLKAGRLSRHSRNVAGVINPRRALLVLDEDECLCTRCAGETQPAGRTHVLVQGTLSITHRW